MSAISPFLKTVAHKVTDPLPLFVGKEPDRGVDVRLVVLYFRDLRLLGVDAAMHLRALVLKSFDDQWVSHVSIEPDRPSGA
ncbi:MAG: hypothetical protein AAFV69_09240 [Pseudomonadota bacterium]